MGQFALGQGVPRFEDPRLSRADDMCVMTLKTNLVPTKINPLGVKGAGEAGCVGALPVVANAVINALGTLGIHHIDLPATPEKLWRAMRAASA